MVEPIRLHFQTGLPFDLNPHHVESTYWDRASEATTVAMISGHEWKCREKPDFIWEAIRLATA